MLTNAGSHRGWPALLSAARISLTLNLGDLVWRGRNQGCDKVRAAPLVLLG
jgi:hypothetical protein